MTTKLNATTSGLIETVDTSGVLELQTGNVSALVIGTDQNANFTGTTAITVPNGTTAQRPTPVNGMMRYNTTLSIFEVYANNTWSAANVTPTPVNTVAPVISGSAIVGQNLTCTTGTWSGSPSAYYYQWLANSTAISGQTANVLTLTLTENGANIACNVTAYNVAGNSTPATSNTLGPVIQGVTASYLIVAGGGGSSTGGGGAGGFLTGSAIFQPANTYSITIGAGGAGNGGTTGRGYQGGNSSISGLSNVAIGGGGGGWDGGVNAAGGDGGSGGGSGDNTNQNGGTGTAGQGNNGGNTGGNNSGYYPAGGGGGAGQAGGNAPNNTTGGYGGNGSTSSISGVATYYAGGGGGGGFNSSVTGGAAGLGGGGAGNGSNGTPGTANTGGGAGGGGGGTPGARGGSGVVIISYAGAQQFGGGVVSSAGGNTIHTFYTSGSLVPLTSLSANYLIVGGGGAGGAGNGGGGGGGAGGLLSGSSLTIDSNSTYAITVGAGGTGASSSIGANGANSTFSAVANAAVGGGGGGWQSVGRNGGSGGGGNYSGGVLAGGTGTAGQGNNGGSSGSGGNYEGGGGGGAGQIGGDGVGSTVAGYGGNGSTSSISGTATYYAGGGGGGTWSGGTAGAGGSGGGGAGGKNGVGTSGTANTGGGGGGGGDGNVAGGSGGSGVVIISYAGSTPMMAGGNVTVVSNTVVHTFTSSGYLTPFVNMNNSLRFRGSASASLSRSVTKAGSQTTWTYSYWFKGSLAQSIGEFLYVTNGSGGSADIVANNTGDGTLYFQYFDGSSYVARLQTTQVFRDPAAWYHFIVVYDSTNATSGNRIRMYVNGSRITAFQIATYPSQNTTTYINGTYTHYIGTASGRNVTDGYFAEVNFIDGQALEPTSFGSFNQYGVWSPVRYAGSYGTNGYYLPFNPNAQGYTGVFNGSSQYLYVASSANLSIAANTAFSVEFFMNLSNFNQTTQYPAPITFGGGSWQFYINSNTMRFYNGTSDVVTGAVSTNIWQHVVVCRNASGQMSMFINGIRTSTATGVTSAVGSSSGTMYISNYQGSGGYCAGNISNVRLVNGSTPYDPTATSITVPTSALTAITNTTLLTCQSATFVDNSPIGNTITNNGAESRIAYPFATTVTNDQSPQGNNWTPNNIGGQAGSTLDYMVDVPTLTSANVANYCVLNPLGGSGLALINGNLTLNYSTLQSAFGTLGVTSGKWYYEATIGSQNTYNLFVGIVNQATTNSTLVGVDANGWAIVVQSDGNNGVKINNSATASTGVTFTSGDVVQVAFDIGASKVWFGKNGTWVGSGDPAAGTNAAYTNLTGTTFFPAMSNYQNSGGSLSANFGQQPFKYTPPSGYLPLNTYNM